VTFLMSLQVGHFTMDNASNNDTFMQELEERLKKRNIPFDAKDRRIMCLPHVINICCSHIIREFMDETLGDDITDGWLDLLPYNISNDQSYEDAAKQDPIAVGRSVVRMIRVSGQ